MRRVAMQAMVVGLVGAGVAGVIAAGYAYAEPNARVAPDKFAEAGETFYWDAAYGVTGAIGLFRQTPLGGDLHFMISCSGVHAGGMQARIFTPTQQGIQLRLKADGMTYRVNRQVSEEGGRPFVEGQGDFPDNFFAALGKSRTVTITYDDQTRTVRGPGKAMAEDFRRYCDELRRRSLVDR